MLVGDTNVLPTFANRIELASQLAAGAVGSARLQFASEYGFGGSAVSPSLTGTFVARYDAADLPASGFGAEVIPLERDQTGKVGVYAQVAAGSVQVVLTAYNDAILASR